MKKQKPLSKAELVGRAQFRHRLRRFEQRSEECARLHGLTIAQYLLLLHVIGTPDRSWALIGEIAEQLVLAHHSAVGLVTRCEEAGLVKRVRSSEDRRAVEVHLTPKGERLVRAVASSLDEEVDALLGYMLD